MKSNEESYPVPEYLFKLKSVSSLQDVERLLDIIMNNRIYLPTYDQLNDPWEGASLDYWPHCCGGSIHRSVGQHHPIAKEMMREYRFLCMSDKLDCPPMWAHYANAHGGVCLVFKTEPSFAIAKPVSYSDEVLVSKGGNDPDIASEEFGSAFYCKRSHWEYENEWRIVLRTSEEYYNFDSNSLCGLVFGCNFPAITSSLIASKCESLDIVPYSSYPILQGYNMAILPYGMRFSFDGSSWESQMYEAYEGHLPPFLQGSGRS